jgi:hypothetical protein
MAYAVGGVALGGWQLIDLGLMGATGLALLALIFLKVVLILLGALLYATGPVMIGLVPTRAGTGFARAWASAVVMLLGLGVVWAAVLAVGAVLIGDASTAGPLIAGHTGFGSLVGGLLLAVAGVASLWVCLKVAKEAVGLLRMQLAAVPALGSHSRSAATAGAGPALARTSSASLRAHGSRLSGATRAAGSELALAGAGGAGLVAAGRAAGFVGRRGLAGTAAAGARVTGAKAAPGARRLMERSRAGALAARMARSGTAAWTASPAKTQTTAPGESGESRHGGRRRDGRSPQPDPPRPAERGPSSAARRPRGGAQDVLHTEGHTATPPTPNRGGRTPSQADRQPPSRSAVAGADAPPHQPSPRPDASPIPADGRPRSGTSRETMPAAGPAPSPSHRPRKRSPRSGGKR